jgi:uncharacterized protein (TIGR02145 family)
MKKLKILSYAISLTMLIALFYGCKKDESLPVLTTNEVSDITLTTAKAGGYISNDGGAAVFARGVCWSTSEKPTIDGNKTSDGTGSGEFTSALTNLKPGTTYHVRAYATNKAGTAYGEELSFTTSIEAPRLSTMAVADITLTTAMTGGNITSNGGDSITARGVCWSTSENPTIANSFTNDGTGSGTFVSHLTGLNAGTTYYVRAYATNAAGTSYGNQVFFTTSPIVVPSLTTAEVTEIGATTAVSGGTVSNDGGGTVTTRGICWSTSENPTISNFISADGTGTGTFTSNLTGLSAGTTYYVRAYATNSAGTGYGNTVTFKTTPLTIATVTTAEVKEITARTAVSGGNVTNDGGAAVTARGIAWNTTGNPTISDKTASGGDGTGIFSSDLTELLPGTIYYVRAWATNSVGTAYGNQISFTTGLTLPVILTDEVSQITFQSAQTGGTIETNGGASITMKGVCWSTKEEPTTESSKTENGQGSGGFTANITGLAPATTYYVRAYAINSVGTAYGSQRSFTTAPAIPTLTTAEVIAISTSGGKTGGNITVDGGAAVTARGVAWSVTENPTIENDIVESGTGSGSFVSDLVGLSPGKVYYVRAYATNAAGTGYGNQVSFTTLVAVGSVTTSPVTGITYTTAISGGEVTGNGGGTISQKGVCWSTTQNPDITGNKTQNGSGAGTFVSNITGLAPGTTYYVRAYVTNQAGTAYGQQISFATNPVGSATLMTTAITNLTSATVTSGGNITDNGGGAITARGVCWSTSPAPLVTGQHTSNGSGNGSFVSNITGLSDGTTYYVRAYATNSSGTAYGNEITFITPVTDRENNVYKTVKIGNQVWMAENLKATRFNDNTVIPEVTSDPAWVLLTTPGYAAYDNLPANKAQYGLIYNWFAVNTGRLCPTGWHAPTDAEFDQLEVTLGLDPSQTDVWGWRGVDQGLKLKSATGWAAGQNGTNASGFSVLPGGYRQWANGDFVGHINDKPLEAMTYFWSNSDDAANGKPEVGWYRRLDGTNNAVYKATTMKAGGKYVRCVKNAE